MIIFKKIFPIDIHECYFRKINTGYVSDNIEYKYTMPSNKMYQILYINHYLQINNIRVINSKSFPISLLLNA